MILIVYVSTTVFITQGKYIGYMFWLLNSHLQACSLQVKSQDVKNRPEDDCSIVETCSLCNKYSCAEVHYSYRNTYPRTSWCLHSRRQESLFLLPYCEFGVRIFRSFAFLLSSTGWRYCWYWLRGLAWKWQILWGHTGCFCWWPLINICRLSHSGTAVTAVTTS